MLDTNAIITESLAPAVTISGLGLLISGLNNRIATVGTRVRTLNVEIRTLSMPQDEERIFNIKQQIPLFLERGYLIRNAMFLMFGALGMMVFTTFALAISKLGYVNWIMVPSWSFLAGLILLFMAVIIEAYETILNLRTLALDIQHGLTAPCVSASSNIEKKPHAK